MTDSSGTLVFRRTDAKSVMLVWQTQLRMPPLMCPLSLSPCSMSLMSSKSSLMTLIRWLKPSCCCFKCWKKETQDKSQSEVWKRRGRAQKPHQDAWCERHSLVWFLGEGLRPHCSVLPIAQLQSDSASGSGTLIRSTDPERKVNAHTVMCPSEKGCYCSHLSSSSQFRH